MIKKKINREVSGSFQDIFAKSVKAAKFFGRENMDDTSVKTITFQVTENCNLCCTYCYQINKSKKVLALEDAKKSLEDLLHSGNIELARKEQDLENLKRNTETEKALLLSSHKKELDTITRTMEEKLVLERANASEYWKKPKVSMRRNLPLPGRIPLPFLKKPERPLKRKNLL